MQWLEKRPWLLGKLCFGESTPDERKRSLLQIMGEGWGGISPCACLLASADVCLFLSAYVCVSSFL